MGENLIRTVDDNYVWYKCKIMQRLGDIMFVFGKEIRKVKQNLQRWFFEPPFPAATMYLTDDSIKKVIGYCIACQWRGLENIWEEFIGMFCCFDASLLYKKW